MSQEGLKHRTKLIIIRIKASIPSFSSKDTSKDRDHGLITEPLQQPHREKQDQIVLCRGEVAHYFRTEDHLQALMPPV